MADTVISIVLGSHNRGPFLKRALESVRQNGISLPYETIVVDGSTDGTRSWLEKQPGIALIKQELYPAAKSWGAFMNLGFKTARGKYILMISDDTLLIPGAVMNGYNFFEKKLENGENLGALAFYFRNYPGDKEYFVAKTVGGQVYLNHGLYLKAALEKIGYLDEQNFFFYNGDSDVCLRLKEAGFETLDCPVAFVEHFKHADKSNRNLHTAEHERSWQNFKARWAKLSDNPGQLSEKTVNTKQYLAFDDKTRTAKKFHSTAAYWKYRLYLIALRIKRAIYA